MDVLSGGRLAAPLLDLDQALPRRAGNIGPPSAAKRFGAVRRRWDWRIVADHGGAMLDLDAIRRSAVAHEPFSYFQATGVLSATSLARVAADFPAISQPGIFPIEEVTGGAAFAELIEEIRGGELEALLEEMLGVELSELPLMVTVRGHCHRRDGRIHTDSTDKVVTCLLYLNQPWESGGGRLRLLRNGTDIEDYIAEVPPDGGTLVAFKRADNSWHGHLPFEGQRRYVMFNWVRSNVSAPLLNSGALIISALRVHL